MARPKNTTPLYHPKFWLMWLVIGLLKLLVLLPQPLLVKLGKLLGRIVLKTAKRRREIAATNLRLCFPDLSPQARHALLVKTFEENTIGYIESFMSWLKPGPIAKVTINGIEHLEAVQGRGKGIIVIGAHFTTLDIAGRLFGQHYPFNVIYRPQNNPIINYVMERGREDFLESAPINQHDFRSMVNCLKRGSILWFPADQDHGAKNSVFAPFFGVTAATLDMPTRLAKLTGAEVVFGSYFRLTDNSYEITFTHLDAFTGSDKLADACLLNKTLENCLLKHPAQYMWVHRRFKTRPAGEASVYE